MIGSLTYLGRKMLESFFSFVMGADAVEKRERLGKVA
jgi:hypothetical protein